MFARVCSQVRAVVPTASLETLASLTLMDRPREAFLAHYARNALSDRLADEVLALTAPAGHDGG